VLTVGNIDGAQITILVCSEILFFPLIFTSSDLSGQILELSKLHGDGDVCCEYCL
jgi:hypothetical protein